MAFAFTVETGTGVAGANAYADLEFCRDHHDGRGQLAAWDGADVSTAITAADAGADTLTVPGHPFETGDGPARPTGGDLPAGLTAGEDYWLVVVDADTVKLATSYANAVAETPVVVDLTDVGSGAMTLEHPDFDAQRAAIVKATDYIEARWGDRFRGVRLTDTQALEVPRAGAYDADGIALTGVPGELKAAAAEYALRAKAAALLPDPSGETHVTAKAETIGPISESVTYATPTPLLPEYPAADRLLRRLVLPGGGTYRA